MGFWISGKNRIDPADPSPHRDPFSRVARRVDVRQCIGYVARRIGRRTDGANSDVRYPTAARAARGAGRRGARRGRSHIPNAAPQSARRSVHSRRLRRRGVRRRGDHRPWICASSGRCIDRRIRWCVRGDGRRVSAGPAARIHRSDAASSVRTGAERAFLGDHPHRVRARAGRRPDCSAALDDGDALRRDVERRRAAAGLLHRGDDHAGHHRRRFAHAGVRRG